MKRLKCRVRERWSGLGLAARLWWGAITAVGVAAVLVLSATSVVEATSHPSAGTSSKSAGSSTARSSNGPGSGGSSSSSGSPSMAGMSGMRSTNSGTSSPDAANAANSACPNVKGATVMPDGMVMAPVPSGPPTAAQQAAANLLVAQTEAALTKYTSLSAATASGYAPATNPNRFMVHYANWRIARTDGFDPSNPAFLMYANTVNGPKLLGAMYLGPAPCMPGPDIGGSLTQWHAHDDLCLSGGQVVGRTNSSGMCATGVHHTNIYFMLHVWTDPSLAATHQFQPDLTRAELGPIIEGQA